MIIERFKNNRGIQLFIVMSILSCFTFNLSRTYLDSVSLINYESVEIDWSEDGEEGNEKLENEKEKTVDFKTLLNPLFIDNYLKNQVILSSVHYY